MNPQSQPKSAMPNSVRTLRIRRLSVKQYHDMQSVGILVSGDPVELLEGVLVEKHGDDPTQFVAVDGEFPPLPIWRLTAEQFERMRAAGIIQRDDPVELVDGMLVRKQAMASAKTG
jgi:hypothetical protein